VLVGRLHVKQIDDIDEADRQIGKVPMQQGARRQCLQRWNVAAGSHDHVRLLDLIVNIVEFVGRRFVWTKDVVVVHIARHHDTQKLSERPRFPGFCDGRRGQGKREVAKIGQVRRLAQQAAIGVRAGAHAAVAAWRYCLSSARNTPLASNNSCGR
jgi:hypothetical protein